jgi:16S rRNA (cytosine1402-N4)-methyltransferase
MNRIKEHFPVMHKEILNLFCLNRSKVFIDGTLGMGGHVKYILESNQLKNIKVIACDCDSDSMHIAREKLTKYQDRIIYKLANFRDIIEEGKLQNIENGFILIDPGLSMYQIKSGQKGYSFSIDSTLDMRKCDGLKISAKEIVNHYSFKELQEIFFKYGEVKKGNELAQRIIETRLSREIESSRDLSEIVEKVYSWRPRKGKTHPSAQVFQALRIFVNNEFADLEVFLNRISQLKRNTVVAILTYHSLEDRIVKRLMKKAERNSVCKRIRPFPMPPSDAEIAANPPSRSAKLRAVKIL